VRAEESARELEREGNWYGEGQGWRCPFIGARGGPERQQ
jgi:hypothetical protein